MGYDKDFYSYIPLWMQNKLDMKLALYRGESWFPEAWSTFRKICLTSSFRDIPDPDVFFAKAEKDITEMVASDDRDGVAFSEDLHL